MSTQTPLHPLVEHESITSSVLHNLNQRHEASKLFYQVEEFEYLGKFGDAYQALQGSPHRTVLEGRSPSYWFLFGTIKLSQGYHRDGLEHYRKAQAFLSGHKGELSEESQELLDFITVRLLCLDVNSTAVERQTGIEAGIASYAKWAQNKAPDELNYFSLLIERLYYEIAKDIPPLTEGLPALYTRHVEIYKAQVPKGNAVIAFPIFLAIINKSKTSEEVKELSSIIEKLLQDNKAPTSLLNTIKGYFQMRMGQLAEGSAQDKYFKEARRFYKLAGNIEAPCEVDSLECLKAGQKNMLAGTDDPNDIRRRVMELIKKLGKLYGKFTDLDFPNRMHATLKQITSINDQMISSPDLTIVACRLWRQLAKATGIKVNATTEFIAVITDIMTIDDLDEAIAVFQRFKEEEEENWDFDTRVNWIRGMAVAHSRLSLFDEAITELEMAETLLQSEWRHATAMEVREQILVIKEKRLHTLSGVDKGYAFDDLLEEIDEAITDDSHYWQRRKAMLSKMLWKVTLLLADKELMPLEEAIPEATKIIKQAEQLVSEFLHEDKTYQAFSDDFQLLKAILLRDQGKADDAVALIEKLIPSKWKIKSRTETEEIRDAELHLQAVMVYTKEFLNNPNSMPAKVLEKRIKSSLSHLKEVLKLSEKHHLVSFYSDALFHEALCHVLLKDPRKALQNLNQASRIQDQLRRASVKGDKFDSFISNALAAQASAEVADLAIKACLQLGDPVACWAWIQNTKARAFSNMLQHGHILTESFSRAMEDISNSQMPWENVTIHAQDVGLLYALERVMKTPVGYSLDNWDKETMDAALASRQAKINSLIDDISQRPSVRGALAVAMGLPATHEDIQWLGNYRYDDKEIVFIDWAHSFDEIIISIYKPGGIRFHGSMAIGTSKDATINIFKCELSIKQVKSWVATYLLNQDMPLESRNATDDLDILSALIEPIAALTNPGDLLVLSPTDILHSIPLHALRIPTKGSDQQQQQRETLIERNPIVYVPSPAILRQCVTRLRMVHPPPPESHPEGTRSSTLIGVKIDGEDETPDRSVDTSLERMSKSLETAEVVTHDMCTLQAFTREAGKTVDILHFHGHMDYQDPRPLQRYLVLADGDTINGRQLADLKFPKGTAPLVAIIACLSGGQQVIAGDEPVGVIPALLAAGAASVIATMWPTDSQAGLQFGEVLYEDKRQSVGANGDEDTDYGRVWNIAQSVRKAVLEIKNNEETSAPYYWAPFVLHGAWLRGVTRSGQLAPNDGLNGLSTQFETYAQIFFPA